MLFDEPLLSGVLIKRYKRFIVDIQFNEKIITAHCPNSGSMMGLLQPGNSVYFWRSSNPKRKLPFTWELVEVNNSLVGINTNRSNALVKEAIQNGAITELQGYDQIRSEIPFGKSRLDLLLSRKREFCYVEVKNVTLVENGIASFPDAVTIRGARHVMELMEAVRKGHRGVVCFVVQRMDAFSFQPAWHIDPTFATTLKKAREGGVEILVYQATISPQGIFITKALPFHLESHL